MLDILLFHTPVAYLLLPLLLGWVLDLLLGDPAWLPHPVVGFGKLISFGEHRLNRGRHRRLKGGLMAVGLILFAYIVGRIVAPTFSPLGGEIPSGGSLPLPLGGRSGGGFLLGVLGEAIIVFYCLAGTTLIREVKAVFLALDRSLDEGRRQVARIVGRDTAQLSAQEVCTAALETLAENLSDGVIAPLFWYLLLDTPGMLAYKMVNTLDSMIGYRTERYRQFGCWAAHIDDVANYIPARLTALLMLLFSTSSTLYTRIKFVLHYGPQHASPNSGWPEAALASILDCRFGGPHDYFGQRFDKPYIGDNPRPLTTADMRRAVSVNRCAEVLMVLLTAAALMLAGLP
ncbi:MAG: cobalamin biosynthesis protein CobD [Prevotella sp.]|nr:cobalamin biosynthesis protein CobD [Prevotella sp.]